MRNPRRFKPYEPNQLLLLPPDMRDWLPEGHPVYFIMEVVGQLNLGAIYGRYDSSKGGQPPFDPTMMVSLLLYAYCVGVPSSRRIEKATYERLPFRVLTADQHPDHDTIADFRKRHLEALAGLFVQVLELCRKVGLVKLGHVSLDGTKVQANASKHKAMSYGRMEKKAAELEVEVAELLAEAQRVDDQEDRRWGKGRRGDELPDELRFKQARLKKIKEAMAELEQEAKEQAQARRERIRQKEEALEKEGRKRQGKTPREPSDKPDPRAQRNFTDPDSRIMKDSASKSFQQAYNCQAAVDAEAQVIVAAEVTQQANDKQQVEPMIEAVKKNTGGEKPTRASMDAGFCGDSNLAYLEEEGIDAYVATGKDRHGDVPQGPPRGRIPRGLSRTQRMARKLRTKKGRATYAQRKAIVEPVFGQIKEVRGFRRFLLRGLGNVAGEWALICLTHNLLKLLGSGWTSGSA